MENHAENSMADTHIMYDISQEKNVRNAKNFTCVSFFAAIIFILLTVFLPNTLVGGEGLKKAAAYLAARCAVSLTACIFAAIAVVFIVRIAKNVGRNWKKRAETICIVLYSIPVISAVSICLLSESAMISDRAGRSLYSAYSICEFKQLAQVLSDMNNAETELTEWNYLSVDKGYKFSENSSKGTVILHTYTSKMYMPVSYNDYHTANRIWERSKHMRGEPSVRIEYYKNSGYVKSLEVRLKYGELEWRVPENVVEFSLLDYVEISDGQAAFKDDCPQIMSDCFEFKMMYVEHLDKNYLLAYMKENADIQLEQAGYILTDKFNDKNTLVIEIN